ncbi:glycosyltransferase family 2 protein, partial [Rosenbergiella epipactidis]|uniref:glycosyltransferase family 2 protein n=1 Tax=Rosenbergiella epipactidis TaxID=1544694 RepID=UPI001F4DC43B
SNDVDKLEDIVSIYTKKGLNINFFKSDIKLNGAGARNKGINLSVNDYICFLDADDTWLPNKLEIYKNNVSNSVGSNNNIYYSKVSIVKNNEVIKIMPLREFLPDKETMANYLFGCAGFIQTSTLLIHKSILEKINFNEKFVRHQDYDLCIRLNAYGCKFIMIRDTLSEYHIDDRPVSIKGESVSYSYFWLSEMSRYLVKKDYYAYKAFKLTNKMLGFQRFYTFLSNFIFSTILSKRDFIFLILSKMK